MDDFELLHAYATRRDEEAFATLVNRHLRLVYSAALRQVRDPEAAEETTQAVFLTLARKAASMRRGTIVAGWLLRATRYVAANARRLTQRRQNMERKLMSQTSPPETESVWSHIAPVLDEALMSLGAVDRDAVTLRFIEQRTYGEIGVLLGMSEDNARKRAARALEKLRLQLGRQGKLVAASVLACALETEALQPVPGELAKRVLAACLDPAALATSAPPVLVRSALEAFQGECRRMFALQGAAGLAVITGIMIVASLAPSFWASRQFPPAAVNLRPARAAQPPLRQAVAEITPQAPAASELKTGTLVLRVVVGETSEPIDKARLRVVCETGQSPRTTNECFTDAFGNAVLTTPAEVTNGWDYCVEIIPDGYVPKFVSWSERQNDMVASIPTTYTAKLEKGTAIGGLVVNEKNEPIAGVRVVLGVFNIAPGSSGDRERVTMRRDYHQEYTDASGRWRCSHVPLRYGMIYYTLYHREYIVGVFVSDAPEAPQPGIIALGEVGRVTQAALAEGNALMALKPGLAVEGTVEDDSGRPIQGARILQDLWWKIAEYQAVTAADGGFRVANLRHPRPLFVVQADGFATSVKLLDLATEPGPFHFTMPKGRWLRGRVTDESGQPVMGAQISVSLDDQRAAVSGIVDWKATTDAQGQFEWHSAPVALWKYYVMAKGYETANEVPLDADGLEHYISLLKSKTPVLPSWSFPGRVLDAQSKQPIETFKVLLQTTERIPPNDINTSSGLNTVANGQDGAFRFSFNSSALTAKLEIQAAGYVPLTVPIECPVTADRYWDLELEPGKPVIGFVRTPEGLPAVDATVVLCTDKHGAFMNVAGHFNTTATQESRTASTDRTDAEGRFSCEPKPGISNIVVAHASGFACFEYRPASEPAKIQLQPWGRVAGRLAIRNQETNGQTVSLGSALVPGTGPRPLLVCLTATTGDDGQFLIEGVPPGDYYIAHERSRSSRFRRSGPAPTSPSHSLIVTVKPGETSRVTLGGTGREIVGKAVFSGRKDYGIWHLDAQTLELKIAGPPGLTKPVRSDYPSPEAYYEALRKYNAQAAPYWKSPAGQAAERSQRRYDLVFQPNGQFHVNDVPPGTYVVEINLPGPSMNGSLYPIGFLRQEVEVPDGDENIPVEWEPLVVPVVPQTSAALPKN